MVRKFEDRPAIREATPLLLGLIGPSGSGKTYSALRLAGGIQRVMGGDIFGIDTESRRMLHYADEFKFRHVPFGAPFSSLDYLEAIEHCVHKGAKTIIVDSMSHEHEGPGGVLEEHDVETKRLAAKWKVSEDVAQMSAWGEPKKKRRRMINSILQMPVNFIFCFRAKDKMKIVKGEKPESKGFMPIAGEEFVFEMLLKCLLLPGANGVPTWQSKFVGEQLMIKLPKPFRPMFSKGDVQLDENVGEALAKWAAGSDRGKPSEDAAALLKRYESCSDAATFRVLEDARKEAWASLSKDDRLSLRQASDTTSDRLKTAEAGALAAADEPATNGAPPADEPSGDRADIE